MKYLPLPGEFYENDTLILTRLLLGKILVHHSGEGLTSGIIVETEAYLQDDPACHASRGMTKGNAMMFSPAGYAYVYFIYGNHFCFNVVGGKKGVGEAVLIRALEPLEGIELMAKRREKARKLTELTNGPGKLCAAMAIGREHNGVFLTETPLFIAEGVEVDDSAIASAPRIGISKAKEKEWRFYLRDNAFVSRIAG